MKRRTRKFNSQLIVFVGLLVILAIARFCSKNYLKPQHLFAILRMASFMGICAIGQTFVVITGGIDLSIAYVITFSNIVAAEIMNGLDQNVFTALTVSLLLGACIGLTNSIMIKYLKLPPFIITLGIGTIVQGLYMIFSKGTPRGNTAPSLAKFFDNSIWGCISGVLILWVFLILIIYLVLKYTKYGRKLYAVGVNSRASIFSGINVDNMIFSVYIISGVMAALTGFLLVGFTGTSYLDAGTKYATSNLAAVVIGGTPITGGGGGYVGTVLGAIIMTVLDDLLVTFSVSQAGRQMIQGIIILLLVFSYTRRRER